MSKKAVVLCSGGLDSATVLAIAKDSGYDCFTLSIDYNQRHSAELTAATNLAKYFNVPHKVVKIDLSAIGGSALTDSSIDVPRFDKDAGIPVTYVPARNTVFLSVALGYAETLECDDIFIGACQIDYSGYPDCRDKFLDAFSSLANLATKRAIEDHKLIIHAPLLNLTKAKTILTGVKLGVAYEHTISCYNATPEGFACGTCDSCNYRKKGFLEANLSDPTRYVGTAKIAV